MVDKRRGAHPPTSFFMGFPNTSFPSLKTNFASCPHFHPNRIGKNGSRMIFFSNLSTNLCPTLSAPHSVHGKRKRGRNPCHVSGEAVGCPVRTTEESAPRKAHPPTFRLLLVKLPTFHQSQNNARTQNLELSSAEFSKSSLHMQLPSANPVQEPTLHFLPWEKNNYMRRQLYQRE